MAFSAYIRNNSTNKTIIIDDIPAPVTLNPGDGAALSGATLTDIQNSLLLRHWDLAGGVEVIINGEAVKLSGMSLLVGSPGDVAGARVYKGTINMGSDPGLPAPSAANLGWTYVVNVASPGDVSYTNLPANITYNVFDEVSSHGSGTWDYMGGAQADDAVENEVPAGTINGVNAVFTLAFAPIGNSQHLYKNGIRQRPGAGNDYTISGAVLTLLAGNVPQPGDSLLCDYRK